MDADFVVVLGDTHGDRRTLNHIRHRLARQRRTGGLGDRLLPVIQLGDFGIFDTNGSRNWLNMLDKVLEEQHAFCWFIDGNHDGHDLLRRRPPGGTGPSGEQWHKRRIAYVPRGTVWEWGGRLLGGLGGAVSLDRGERHEGIDWFPEEAVSRADVQQLERSCAGRRLDVLFSHDTPLREIPWRTGFSVTGDLAAQCAHSRSMVSQAADLSGAQLVIHGHYHLRRRVPEYLTDGGNSVSVECVNAVARNGSCVRLNLRDLSVDDLDLTARRP